MKLKQHLKFLREKKDFTQEQLAQKAGCALRVIQAAEQGQTEPNPSNRLKICQALGITEAEFFGFSGIAESANHYGRDIREVPVISWIRVNKFNPAESIPSTWFEGKIKTTTEGENLFALRVENASMSPEFNPGDVVVIRPNTAIQSGDYVIVADSRGKSALFKQYRKYGQKVILRTLNQEYEEIELEGNQRYRIIGKVVEKIKKY